MTFPPGRTAFPLEGDSLRLEAVKRLARDGGVAQLLAMLDDPSWSVRREVVAALAARGSAAVGPLCEALRDRRGSEAGIAATIDALAAVSGDADPALAAMVGEAELPVLADIAHILGRRRTLFALPTVVMLSRHPDDNVAVAAIEALGRIGGRAAVDSLVNAVESGNFFRTFPAIDVLGRSGDPRAVAPLRALLDLPQYAAEAARALGRTGDVAATSPLMRLLSRSPSALVRLSALALAELHERHRERFGNSDAIEAGIRGGLPEPGVVRQLLRAIGEGEPAERAAICFLLGVLGDPSAAPALTALLEAPPLVADAAATALRRLGPRVEEDIRRAIKTGAGSHRRALLPLVSSAAAAPDVVPCLGDGDPDVRVLACQALGRMGAVTEVGALFPLLADPDARVAFAAIAAVQSLGSAKTESLAIEAAGSTNVRVRRAALRILTYFGASAALDVLLRALHDPDERVRESAVQGLPFMDDPRAFEALLASARDPSERTRAVAMRSLGQGVDDLRASACLLKGVTDADAWVRYYACQSLGKLAAEPAVHAILALLRDPAGQVRVAAVEALSCLSGEVAVEALKAAVSDADSDIQRAAILGLGVARRAEALPLMLKAAHATDPATRLVAVSALAGFRVPAVLNALRQAASDPEESVRTAAVGFLAAMTGAEATGVLADLLRGNPATEPVLTALSVYVEGRIAGLVAALEHADDETAPALTSALVRLRRPDATLALIQAMSMANAAARKAVASALSVVASQEALATLRLSADGDPEPEVRQICALLLAR